jgi:hypothetical protein
MAVFGNIITGQRSMSHSGRPLIDAPGRRVWPIRPPVTKRFGNTQDLLPSLPQSYSQGGNSPVKNKPFDKISSQMVAPSRRNPIEVIRQFIRGKIDAMSTEEYARAHAKIKKMKAFVDDLEKEFQSNR